MTADVRAAAEAWVEAVNLAAQEHPGLRIPSMMLPEAKAFTAALDRLSVTLAEMPVLLAERTERSRLTCEVIPALQATIAAQAAELGRLRKMIEESR